MMIPAQLFKQSLGVANVAFRWLKWIIGLFALALVFLIANENLNLDIEVDGIGAIDPYLAAGFSLLLLSLILYLVVFSLTMLYLSVWKLWNTALRTK